MLSKFILAALVASPLVAAHGKVAVMTGDAGGNTTALGIQGGVVPGPGKNKVTEVDTTVFKSNKAASDGLGKTSAGPNTLADMTSVMAQSGDTLPQVSPGGSLSGTVHIVTTDGAGPYTAVIDPTGTGAFASGTEATVTQQVPGKKGNIAAPKQRSLIARTLVKMGIMKRASNVNEDFPFAATIPAGTTCTGTVGGQNNVCLAKIVNPSNAGPFGGVVAFQMTGAGGASTASNSTAAAGANTANTANTAKTANSASTAKTAKAAKADKNARAPIGAKFRA
ncbi:Uncharacterized protein BP5553_04121 [Venustampulla echinocandica]|uniref:Cell surface protein n=1 Tax=Venustampulla echinocandica TaxID=2656787 RepID=A0A370TW77_9HELO|nr:Uncharacterized protein BP5553_04121 [Venustampulla echinocandica]RDL39781.1 Uncharacterized protein BP5553_04121 [Venustampulla echinocandica]